MTIENKVLSSVFVKRFYSENTGFFLVILGVCFGFLKSAQHFELNGLLAEKPILYLIPFFFWVLYGLKVFQFCRRVARSKQNHLISIVELSGKRRLFISSMRLQPGLLIPVNGYGVFMAGVAANQQKWFSAFIVSFFLICMWVILSFWFYHDLQKPKEFGFEVTKRWFRWQPKKYFTLYIHYLFLEKGVKLILLKLIAMAVLFGLIQVFLHNDPDFRFITLGVLLAATTNSFFAFDYAQFEQSQLKLYRNLPLSFRTRTVSFFLTFFYLSIPEYFILYGQTLGYVQLDSLMFLSLMLPALLLLFLSFSYQKSMHQELYTKQIFFVSAALFFVILGHINALWLSTFSILFSIVIFKFWLIKSEVI